MRDGGGFAGKPLISWLILSNGEPFCQKRGCAALAEAVRALGKTVWAFSGYTLEQLQAMAGADP